MSQNITLLLYTVGDMAAAKKLFGTFLQAEPYVDSPYYVGYKVGELEIGFTPGQNKGVGSPVAYTQVSDIQATLKTLTEAGATVAEEPKDVGGGLLVAAVKDADGNILGLRQQSESLKI
jgi:predicted enzyme related to lactoylglutathione lyase